MAIATVSPRIGQISLERYGLGSTFVAGGSVEADPMNRRRPGGQIRTLTICWAGHTNEQIRAALGVPLSVPPDTEAIR